MKLFPRISPGPWWQWTEDNAALSRPQITAAARLFTLRRNSMTLSSSIQHNHELTPAITVMSRARDGSYYLQLDCWIVPCRRWIKCAVLVSQSHLNLASFFVYTSSKYFLCAPRSKWKWDGSSELFWNLKHFLSTETSGGQRSNKYFCGIRTILKVVAGSMSCGLWCVAVVVVGMKHYHN